MAHVYMRIKATFIHQNSVTGIIKSSGGRSTKESLKVSFFPTYSSPLSKPAAYITHNLIQLRRQQFAQRLRCVMLAAANVASRR